MQKILIADAIHASGIEILKNASFVVDQQTDISPEALLQQIVSYDALVVRSRSTVTKEIIEAGRNLKVIARAGTGVDNIDVQAAKDKGIVVVNAKGANAQSVAEHTMALMLALSRNLFPILTSTKQGKWEKKQYTASEVSGKTLGIIGFGTIGKIVGSIAESFGMRILPYSRSVGDLQTLLKQSDIITIHVSFSKETNHLIGKKELALMKKTAYCINTSRGAIIDEQALIEALKNQTIAGAALDVFENEPLSTDSALLELPNILLTPHIASSSREGAEKISKIIAHDIVSVLTGKPPKNSV